MAVKSPGTRRPRRRRTPQDARQEILDTACELITERPLHEVTVLAIMERTTLSRKSFYVYFRDHSELIAALVRLLRAQADAALAQWRRGHPSGPRGRLRATARFYRRHGTIMRALFSASADDSHLAAARHDLTEPVIDAAVQAISPIAADPDPQRLRDRPRPRHHEPAQHARLPPDATDADLDQLTDTLAGIWNAPPPAPTLHRAGGREASLSTTRAAYEFGSREEMTRITPQQLPRAQRAGPSARRRVGQADQDIPAQVLLAQVLNVLAFHRLDAAVMAGDGVTVRGHPGGGESIPLAARLPSMNWQAPEPPRRRRGHAALGLDDAGR